MRVLFYLIWIAILLVPQMAVRISLFDLSLNPGFVLLLVLYISFNETFMAGLISVVLLSYFTGIFSFAPQAYFILNYLIIFVAIQMVIDRIFTEAYLTKSLWVFPLSIFFQFLTSFSLDASRLFLGEGEFWFEVLVQAAVNSLVSFPLFIVLDWTYGHWTRIFSRRKAHLTGADLYQAKSNQSKYF